MSQATGPAGDQRTIPIQVDWSDEPAAVYANDVQVSANPRDVALLFMEFQAMAGRGGVAVDQMPKAKVVANVRLSPEAFFELAATVSSAWNLYVQQYGDPKERNAKFKLMGAAGRQLDGLG